MSLTDDRPANKPNINQRQITASLNLDKTNIRALRRITNELNVIKAEHPEFIVTPFDLKESYMDWVVVLPGPMGTPYAGGEFIVDVAFPFTYPIEPPLVKFRTPLLHPNVSLSGKVCLNILKAGEWSPLLSLGTVLISVQALLSDPNPDDPLNVKIADLFLKNKAGFEMQATAMTVKYASPGKPRMRGAPIGEADEDAQQFEHLQRDQDGRLVDDDELVERFTRRRRHARSCFCVLRSLYFNTCNVLRFFYHL